MFAAGRAVGLTTGMVVGVPVPEEEAAESAPLEQATLQAVAEAEDQGISGKAITPFLLARIAELTGGDSLRANICLVKNNARVGSAIAVALASMQQRQQQGAAAQSTAPGSGPPVVIGGIVQDLVAVSDKPMADRSSNPGSAAVAWGGVGFNVAAVLASLGAHPVFVTAVGDDEAGRAAVAHCLGAGMGGSSIVTVPGATTARYIAIHDTDGDLTAGIAAMDVFDHFPATALVGVEAAIAEAAFVLVDLNLPAAILAEVARLCRVHGRPLCVEPTSTPKAQQKGRALAADATVLFPNADEHAAIAGRNGAAGLFSLPNSILDTIVVRWGDGRWLVICSCLFVCLFVCLC